MYMLVPWSQSASITVRYTERYCAWNQRNSEVAFGWDRLPAELQEPEDASCNRKATTTAAPRPTE